MSHTNTAAPIEMPFGLMTRVGPGNHILDGGPDPPMGRSNFERGKGCPIVICAKAAEPIEMTFGLWAWAGPWNHELYGGPDPPIGRLNFG